MGTEQQGGRVHPRLVWAGTALAVLGLVGISVGIIDSSWWWSVAGVVVLVVGAVVAWRAGVRSDGRVEDPAAEVDDVVHGTTRSPGSRGMALSPEGRARSAELDGRRRALELAAHEAPRPGPTRASAVVLLLVTLFLLGAQWELYPLEYPGQTNATRALGVDIVVGIVGLRLITSPDASHRVASTVAVVAGLALVLNGWLAAHDETSTAAVEVVVGVLVCVSAGAVLAWDVRRSGSAAVTSVPPSDA